MEIQQIVSTLKTTKGANRRVFWEKPLKLKKDYREGNTIIKKTSLVVRSGIDYDNISSVQEARETGELPSENAGLPWGEWAEFPYHIQHKGNDYARFYPASGVDIATGEEFRPVTEYFLNGVNVNDIEPSDPEATKNWWKGMCLASEFPKPDDEPPRCFTIKAENVVSIG
jgi:hypothetical protein